MGEEFELGQPERQLPLVSVVFAYYENPEMLAMQWNQISQYPESLKRVIEIVVVDDGSPNNPADKVARPSSLPPVSIFRILRDVRWNQDAARNIGAHEARAEWLLLTDIDHIVPKLTLQTVVTLNKNPSVFYSFPRIKYESNEAREPHPNSYLMTKALYWGIGGHDEDYAGIYGKDFLFRKRALKYSHEILLEDAPLARVGTSVIADASSRTISRENTLNQRSWGYLLQGLKAARLWRGVQTLTEPYRRVV